MAAAAATLLREAGMETETEFFHTASELLKAHKQGTSWDLILLDIMMDDGQDGINVAESKLSGELSAEAAYTGKPEAGIAALPGKA